MKRKQPVELLKKPRHDLTVNDSSLPSANARSASPDYGSAWQMGALNPRIIVEVWL